MHNKTKIFNLSSLKKSSNDLKKKINDKKNAINEK